jgi:hemerythrin
MPEFKWSSENEVFLPTVDAEHKELFVLCDTLESGVRGRADAAKVRICLDQLAAHLEAHFQHEEWLMRAVGYPSYGWHRAQHDTARRRLKLLAPAASAGDEEAAALLLDFLAGWLQDHTCLTDKMMAAFVRNYSRSRPRQWAGISSEAAQIQSTQMAPAQK